ncbi:hypothetical protein [Methylobacterium sp. J-076]|uniref:hypothetical protein n=1 Tax=Methylobacterium sp. J-076 TaxID=2836655 RepID=UPI001FB9584B|nr:hypothetical protein [Methylobacterium sp. J-076]MCJ2011768.1 hypothetical protein [Methylobacterium sp. J-076]
MISATMQAKPLTLADLRNAGIITSTEIVAAIDLFMRDPAAPLYRFASGHTLDVAGILAVEMMGDALPAQSILQEKILRTKIAAAIMAAHPVSP